MSLDVSDWASLTIAKRWYRLPYHVAHISIQKEGQTFQYESIRKGKTTTPLTKKGKYTLLYWTFFFQRKGR